MTDTLIFDDVTLDTSPPLADVEYPCEKCGNETGWSGRGRRKKYCDDCKPKATRTAGVRVTGNASNLAAQAAKTLASINAVMAMGVGALGFFRTMGAVMDKNDDFEKAAYAALVTDPKLCQSILSVGQTSAKISLGMAYLTLGMGVAPVISEEYREKKAARLVEMDV